MTESRRRWIDDDSDEYESGEETETQPTSVSPMRRESIFPDQAKPDLIALAVDCLMKQIPLMTAPYKFLMLGVPYKVKTGKKMAEALFPSEVETAPYHFKILFNGPAPTGKCIATAESVEAAQALVHFHGKKLLGRTLFLDVFQDREALHKPKYPGPVKKTAAKPKALLIIPEPKLDENSPQRSEAASPTWKEDLPTPPTHENPPRREQTEEEKQSRR